MALADLFFRAPTPTAAPGASRDYVPDTRKSDGSLAAFTDRVRTEVVNAYPTDAVASLAAVGDAATVSVLGMNTLIVNFPTAPAGWAGTFVVEGTADAGFSDVSALSSLVYGGGNSPPLAALTAPGIYEITVTGLTSARVRCTTAVTGGPVSVLARAANGNKSIRVGNPAGNPLTVVGKGFRTAPVSFTRPANTTQYAVGSVMSSGTVVVPVQLLPLRAAGLTARLSRALVSCDDTAASGVSGLFIRLYLFQFYPSPTPSTVADGVAFAGTYNGAQASNCMGHIDVPLTMSFTDGSKGSAGIPSALGSLLTVVGDANGIVYMVPVVMGAAYSPKNGGKWFFTFEGDQD